MSKKAGNCINKIGEQTYSQSIEELERIIVELETREDSLDNIMPKLAKAMEIIEHCQNEIKGYDAKLQKILNQQEEA